MQPLEGRTKNYFLTELYQSYKADPQSPQYPPSHFNRFTAGFAEPEGVRPPAAFPAETVRFRVLSRAFRANDACHFLRMGFKRQ